MPENLVDAVRERLDAMRLQVTGRPTTVDLPACLDLLERLLTQYELFCNIGGWRETDDGESLDISREESNRVELAGRAVEAAFAKFAEWKTKAR
jgi:hypothetical protein